MKLVTLLKRREKNYQYQKTHINTSLSLSDQTRMRPNITTSGANKKKTLDKVPSPGETQSRWNAGLRIVSNGAGE